jgi:lauroyl/myristoyl acyltransferase
VRHASGALATGRWDLRLDGDPPGAEPCVYVTAHIGSMQALRYALRARGVPAATVLGPYNLDRSQAIPQDRVFDRRYTLDFPHALPSSAAHRLRSALKRGSLIAAADMPEKGGIPARVLGGPALLDPRPFRLARLSGTDCRPAFVTMPEGRWTLTLGPVLSGDERACAEAFGRVFARVASAAPLDIDGVVYTHRAGHSR